MIAVDLAALPEAHLRRLFDAFQLELRYHRRRHELTIRATVRADMVEPLRAAVRQTTGSHEMTTKTQKARQPPGQTVSHALGAPGMSPSEWETTVASNDVDTVAIDGCWPLPPRGH